MINYYYSRAAQSGRRLPFGNPLANALVVVVGTLAVAVFIVLGFFAFLALGTLVLVLAAIVGIRAWWFSRKLSRRAEREAAAARRTGGPDSARIHVIEGEFREVSGAGDDHGSRAK